MAALTDAEQRELLQNTREIKAQFDPRNPAGLRDALVRTGQRLAAVQAAVDDQADDESNLSATVKAELAAARTELLAAIDEATASTPQGA